ncbi:hypothetical protein A4A49_45333, partial [Nicotiana attenuata]
IPAKRALATVSNVVNPIVEAYDKLASAVKIMSTGTKMDDRGDVVEKGNGLTPLSPGFSKTEHIVIPSQAVDCDDNNVHLHSKGVGDRDAGDIEAAGDSPQVGKELQQHKASVTGSSCQQVVQTTHPQGHAAGQLSRTVGNAYDGLMSAAYLANVKIDHDSKLKKGQLVVVDNTVAHQSATLLI